MKIGMVPVIAFSLIQLTGCNENPQDTSDSDRQRIQALETEIDDLKSKELFPRIGFIVTNLKRPAQAVVRFYNQRGTAEQWIKEGKNAVKWTRLPAVFGRAYNLSLEASG